MSSPVRTRRRARERGAPSGLGRLGILAALGLAGCGASRPPADGPNVLWVVWDTVRADRLGPYGHDVDTTPELDRWAESARVFDCTSASCWTIPAHASMFTGLYPSEHGFSEITAKLGDEHETLAELLGGAGYETYLFSANPFVSERYGFHQGFDVEEHPFDPALRERAIELVRAKWHGDDAGTLPDPLSGDNPSNWLLKSCGELANERLFEFLDSRDERRPFFAFVNLMEAHTIRMPSEESRARVLDANGVGRSYSIDQRQARFQHASTGIEPPIPRGQLDVLRGVYDATLVELDAMLGAVLDRLERDGLLDDTIVVLTSDHGEHLGDKGSWLHQYSLYEGVTRVPLIVWAPEHLEPGREERPVSNVDLFPTILEMTGVEGPDWRGPESLLRPREGRAIAVEYPAAYEPLIAQQERAFPDWDPAPYRRTIRALRLGRWKYYRYSDGEELLFDVAGDPREARELAADEADVAGRLGELLEAWTESRAILGQGAGRTEQRDLTDEERELLRDLGYL